MAPKLISKVPVTAANADVCMCIRCPIQTNSSTRDKKSSLKNAKGIKTGKAMMPGLYCSTGANDYLALDFKQICICESCPVYIEYRLVKGQPTLYFCRDGASR